MPDSVDKSTFFNRLVNMVFRGFLPGVFFAILWQFLITIVLAIVCFASQFDRIVEELRKNPNSLPQIEFGIGYLVFLIGLSYISAGVVEEYTKYAFSRKITWCNCGNGPDVINMYNPPTPFETISKIALVSLGFAFCENLSYVLLGQADMTVSERCILALARGLVSLPVHLVCSIFTGLRLAAYDIQKYNALQQHVTNAPVSSAVVMAPPDSLPPTVHVPIPSDITTTRDHSRNELSGSEESLQLLNQPQSATQIQDVELPSLHTVDLQHGAPASSDHVVLTIETGAGIPVASQVAPAHVQLFVPYSISYKDLAVVLLPAIMVHGTFNFILFLTEALWAQEKYFVVSIIVVVSIMVISSLALYSQLEKAYPFLARYQIPPPFTWTRLKMPPIRSCIRAIISRR